MRQRKRIFSSIMMGILALSIMLAIAPLTSAAGSITITPTSGAPSGTITVAGTGFAATQPAVVVMGNEITVVNETHVIPSPTGTGPFTAYTSHGSIKPGSFYYHCVVSSDTNVVESNYYDSGDGTLTSDSTYALNPFVNYVTGAFGRSTSSAWDGYTVSFICSYTYYQYNVTTSPITTSAAGAFSATVSIPAAATNGNLVVTAFDNKGNKATTTLSVIPEGLSIGLVVALSAVAVIGGSYFLRKPKRNIIDPINPG